MNGGKEIRDIQYDSERLTLQFSDGKGKVVPLSKIDRLTRVFGKSKRSKREGWLRILDFIIDPLLASTESEKDLIGIVIHSEQGNSTRYQLKEAKDQSLLIKINKLCHEKGWD